MSLASGETMPVFVHHVVSSLLLSETVESVLRSDRQSKLDALFHKN
jgi:hypothetical protein